MNSLLQEMWKREANTGRWFCSTQVTYQIWLAFQAHAGKAHFVNDASKRPTADLHIKFVQVCDM